MTDEKHHDDHANHRHRHGSAEERRQKQILHALENLTKKVMHMSNQLDDLKAAVAKDTDAENSAITLLQGLKAKLDAAINDPVALKALSDQIGSNADALAAAVVANTPSE